MPVTHLITDDLLMFKVSEEVNAKAFYSAWNTIQSDPAFQPPMNTLVDLRGAQVDIPGDDILKMVEYLEAHRSMKRVVIVAERGSFTYAMGRMFCINAECAGFCSEIFLSMSEALAWLNDDSVDETIAPYIGPV